MSSSRLVRIADSDPMHRARLSLNVYTADAFGAIAKSPMVARVFGHRDEGDDRSRAREMQHRPSEPRSRTIGARNRDPLVIWPFVKLRNRRNPSFLRKMDASRLARDRRRRHTSSQPSIFLLAIHTANYVSPPIAYAPSDAT